MTLHKLMLEMRGTKAKHTPGPWVINGLDIATMEEYPVVANLADSVTNIADQWLIAAAPDALVAIRNALVHLKHLQDLSPRDIGTVEQIRESLEYIILKATGCAE